MTAELWGDIDHDLASAQKHFANGIALFRSERFVAQTNPDYYDEMAFLHTMQSGYTSFESALKRLFGLLQEDLPRGPRLARRAASACSSRHRGSEARDPGR